ncbi:MAG: GNAT family N-acetyltransferase [Pseudomonadota bacterium]
MHDLPRRLVPCEIEAVAALARTVWQATYPGLIGEAQIEYMLGDRYAATRIRTQFDDPLHAWWGLGRPLAGFAHAFIAGSICKLDKLYVHPERQRRGLGALLFAAACDWARAQGATHIRLQVNRGNARAIRAYEKYGLQIVESRVFDIGAGFVMDDHVMECAL